MENKIDQLVESFYSNGFAVNECFFDREQVKSLLAALQSRESELRAAGIGKEAAYTKIKDIRSDKILWLEQGENDIIDSIFFTVMDEIRVALNRRCFLGLNSFEFHFAKYEPGTFYKRHKDVFKNDDARKVSLIVYLNENWKEGDGGELKLYTEETITVSPQAGTIALFESHIEHEVMPSFINRYSITGWLKNEDFIL